MKIKSKRYKGIALNFYGKDYNINQEGWLDASEDTCKSILVDFPNDWKNPEAKAEVNFKVPENGISEAEYKEIVEKLAKQESRNETLSTEIEKERDSTKLWKDEFDKLNSASTDTDTSTAPIESSTITSDELEAIYDLFKHSKKELEELANTLGIKEEEYNSLSAKELSIFLAEKTLV